MNQATPAVAARTTAAAMKSVLLPLLADFLHPQSVGHGQGPLQHRFLSEHLPVEQQPVLSTCICISSSSLDTCSHQSNKQSLHYIFHLRSRTSPCKHIRQRWWRSNPRDTCNHQHSQCSRRCIFQWRSSSFLCIQLNQQLIPFIFLFNCYNRLY